MKREQQIVATGAASGIVLMIALLYVLTQHVLPMPEIADEAAARIAYALGAEVFALIPFFLMMIWVGNSRFLSDAIDPTRHVENAKQEIDGRVADNTLQQNFVFVVASLAVATVIPVEYLQLVWAAAIVFVVARIVFWIGYRWDPLYRAPGMSATAYMNLGMILYVLYQIFV